MSQHFDVSGRTVLITGGCRGLGLIMARGFVEAGANVYVTTRAANVTPEAAAKLAVDGRRPTVITDTDLSSEEGARALAEELARRESQLDVLINNAGDTEAAPLEEHDAGIWERVIAINLTGLFHVTRFMLPLLRASSASGVPARVINIGSISGIGVSSRDNFSYVATKAGVHHLTHHLALKLGPDNILVNAIAAGVFQTEMSDLLPTDLRARLLAASPVGRLGSPAELVATTIFLAAPGSSYINGTVLALDGGMSMTTLGS